MFFFSFRLVDLFVGVSTSLTQTQNMIRTKPFMNDDLTFCVSRSKSFPAYLNVMRTYSPIMWIFIFVLSYINSAILYVALKFSKNEKKIDFFYCNLLVSHRLFMNSPINLKPKSTWLRIYITAIIIFGFFFFGCSLTFIQMRIISPYRPKQVNEKQIILNEKFIIVSTPDILERIKLSADVSL